MARELPVPSHFDPDRVETIYHIPYGQRAEEAEAWARRHDLGPAAEDPVRICLLAVDCQNTFCLPQYDLFVAGRSGRGAVEDTARLCRFLYRNLGSVTQVTATLDTHRAMQIFHPIFWVDEAGVHPAPNTTLSLEDLEAGRWRVNPAVAPHVAGGDLDWLQEHALHYARALSEEGKYPLIVWPYHSMLGGPGHALVSALQEAFFFHAIARAAPTRYELKGDHPLTEAYSALGPEVRQGPRGEPLGSKNEALMDHLLGFDTVVVAGQAQSHCVTWTVSDLLAEIRARDPSLAGRVYLLEDCTSPVVVPDVVDFTEQAEAAYRRFQEAGMHVVQSTTPLAEWPDLALP